MYDGNADKWVVDLCAHDVIDGLFSLSLAIIADDLAVVVVWYGSDQSDCIAVNDSL